MTYSQKLHHEFVRLGRMRFRLKNKMLAILPEIYKSGVYKKYAGSIVEYAGKYGDIAKSTVIRRLGLEKKLENKPYLKEAIKTVGLQKVAIVANLATPETDKAFADKVRNMSKTAVQTLAKELRQKQITNFCSQCHAKSENIKIELDEEMTFMFLKLKNRLGKNLGNKEIMRKILEEVAEKEFPKSVTGHTLTKPKKDDKISRYIPAGKKRQIIARTNGKCSYPNCNSPFQVLHHVDRFSESKNHDFVIPLCEIHHEFAHNNLIRNEKLAAEKWQLSVIRPPAVHVSQAEILYKEYRQKASA
ncbi:MAG: hypothetical protein ABIH78_00695 [Candidatus Peregrinibacteria bacterium]